MKNINLTKIGFFNPGRLTDEEIEMSFVTRIAFFQYIFKKIVAEKANSIPQHHLVIGQRGMGKTSLLVRVAVELRKRPYCENFIGLTFPEEQYNIDRLSKFWLNCLDALADALDREKQTEFTKLLDEEIDGISKNHYQENNAIYAIFEKWVNRIKRRPVLLVDNLNLIFEKISKEEQHQLRAILMTNNAPIMLGASATTIDDTIDYGSAFYDAFQIQYLKKLTFEESLEVLQNLAKITGKTDFEQIIYQNRGRLGALYQLTGGTPRTISMLFPLIQSGFSDEIQSDLDALLDVVTPLYKARFEELPAQLQVVLDAIALHWEPITLEQLRNVTQLENAQLSPQLKRLIDVGWLQKLDAFEAKGSAYELSERFFNIWYLMRRSSRRQKRELYCLSKFLESMYGEEVERMAQSRLGLRNTSPNQVFYDLALADILKNEALSKQLKTKSYSELLELSKTDLAILKNFEIPDNEIKARIEKLKKNLLSNFEGQLYVECENILKEIRNLENENEWICNALGLVKTELGDFLNAEQAYLKAIELNSKYVFPWNNLGDLYRMHLNKFDEAEKAYLNALDIDNEYTYAWNALGNLYRVNLRDFKEAENCFKKSLEIDNDNSFTWYYLGQLLGNELKKYTSAENAFLISIKLNNKNVFAFNELGNLYQSHLGQYKESENAYKQAIAIDKNYSFAWNGLGHLYHYHILNFQEAEEAYFNSIRTNKDILSPWLNLADLYWNELGKYNKAENALLKILEINNSLATVWNKLGNLYQDYLGNSISAEKAYLQAITLEDEKAFLYNLVFLYFNKLNRKAEARKIFKGIKVGSNYKDSHFLLETLFHYLDGNSGLAKIHLIQALTEIENELPRITQDDWWRSAAIAVKLGYGEHFLDVLTETGNDVILKPYFVAIQSLIQPKPDAFFNSIAAEVREPAKKIMEIMKKYME